MEQLFKRPEGFYATSYGYFAVIMPGLEAGENELSHRCSEDEDGLRHFVYRNNFSGDLTELRWRGEMTLLPEDVARFILAKGYARNLNETEAAAYENLRQEEKKIDNKNKNEENSQSKAKNMEKTQAIDTEAEIVMDGGDGAPMNTAGKAAQGQEIVTDGGDGTPMAKPENTEETGGSETEKETATKRGRPRKTTETQ